MDGGSHLESWVEYRCLLERLLCFEFASFVSIYKEKCLLQKVQLILKGNKKKAKVL